MNQILSSNSKAFLANMSQEKAVVRGVYWPPGEVGAPGVVAEQEEQGQEEAGQEAVQEGTLHVPGGGGLWWSRGGGG